MKKQKIQILILLVLCIVCVGGYFIIRNHTFETEEKPFPLTLPTSIRMM